MRVRRAIASVILASVATLLSISPVQPAGEVYGNLSDGWVLHAQNSLKHAAMQGPKWNSHRTTIERYIQDVAYALQGTVLATHSGDHAVAAINARHAIWLLEQGVQKQFFHKADIEPILSRLRPYVSSTMSLNGPSGNGQGKVASRRSRNE